MQTDQVVFEGSERERQLARDIWLAMRMMGASFADQAPIEQPLTTLATFFKRMPALANEDDVDAIIDAALSKNAAVFQRRVGDDGLVVFVTTKVGRAPVPVEEDDRHTFRSRLTEPAPAPVVEEPVAEEPPVEPTRVADIWLRPSETVAGAEEAEDQDAVEAVEEELVGVEAAADATTTATLAEGEMAPVAEAETAPEVAPVVEEPPSVSIDELREALGERLAADLRFVSFGDEWYLDEQLPRLSRGDFRRIRDYISERGEPLSDDDLLTDVFGRRVTDRDYQMLRFGLNQRLSKEKKEFDFVGTSDLRLWSASGLPAIGTPKRKPQEIGQDYRFLLESTEAVEVGTAVQRSLTFYEYEYGVLPLDAELSAFFPKPLLEDQRMAVLRFEVPQLYLSYLVELRYPTGNRGGFISGLDAFFIENLVPGARIAIERTDNNGRYTVRFNQTGEQERRLLHLDDRRGRFVFRPVTFYCEVDEDLLLADNKFPGLNNAKPLEDRERRRPEAVARTTFERVGDQVGGPGQSRFWALFDDLFAAVNIERPFTREHLRAVLEAGSAPEFERDPQGDAYFYEPGKAQ